MTLLEVQNLRVYFPVYAGKVRQKIVGHIKAVDGVSFSLGKGEILGLVGESGCGKTTIARAILGLLPKTEGRVLFEGQDLDAISQNQQQAWRKRVQAVFQDPYLSLNPRMSAEDAIAEGLDIHRLCRSKKERADKVVELLKLVDLNPDARFRFPNEFSAGQRQRIAIARALALEPSLVICDEPVSSLDVSVQDQILKLILDLRGRLGLSFLFITHDLAVVRQISDSVAVMYLGKIMEEARSEDLYRNPLHPYTRVLFSAVPVPDPWVARQREKLRAVGEVPSAEHIPPGCRFHPRCPLAVPECQEKEPLLVDKGAGHLVACHRCA